MNSQSVEFNVFQFHTTEVRTVLRDGQVWFVAGDVAKALNYTGAVQMTRVLDEDEKGVHTMHTLGGDQQVVIISESGLYHALLKSRKPEAVPFRKWVTGEVLPAIRKQGFYGAKPEQQGPSHSTRHPELLSGFWAGLKFYTLEDGKKCPYPGDDHNS
ncbi:hypothetical protein HF563_17490 [Acidithiobacillus ferridurans]|nr:hypothetical protein [Acidithiobacillus ferridurans]